MQSLIIIFLFVIFIFSNDITRKTFVLNKQNFDTRMIKSYGYCNKDSYGFLKFVNNKYNIKENLNIYNYKVKAPSDWIIFKNDKPYENKKFILLNYVKNNNIKFKKKNSNNWISSKDVVYTTGINSIKFNISKKTKLNAKINIFHNINNQKKILETIKINQTIYPNEKIILNLTTNKLNNRTNRLILGIDFSDIKNFELINDITIDLQNKFNIDKLKIIENHKDCYYVSK